MSVLSSRHCAWWSLGDDERFARACVIAGVLAEAGLLELEIGVPSMCMTRRAKARETDLPRTLAMSARGTMIRGDGVSLLIDDDVLRWAGDGPAALALDRAFSGLPKPPPATA